MPGRFLIEILNVGGDTEVHFSSIFNKDGTGTITSIATQISYFHGIININTSPTYFPEISRRSKNSFGVIYGPRNTHIGGNSEPIYLNSMSIKDQPLIRFFIDVLCEQGFVSLIKGDISKLPHYTQTYFTTGGRLVIRKSGEESPLINALYEKYSKNLLRITENVYLFDFNGISYTEFCNVVGPIYRNITGNNVIHTATAMTVPLIVPGFPIENTKVSVDVEVLEKTSQFYYIKMIKNHFSVDFSTVGLNTVSAETFKEALLKSKKSAIIHYDIDSSVLRIFSAFCFDSTKWTVPFSFTKENIDMLFTYSGFPSSDQEKVIIPNRLIHKNSGTIVSPVSGRMFLTPIKENENSFKELETFISRLFNISSLKYSTDIKKSAPTFDCDEFYIQFCIIAPKKAVDKNNTVLVNWKVNKEIVEYLKHLNFNIADSWSVGASGVVLGIANVFEGSSSFEVTPIGVGTVDLIKNLVFDLSKTEYLNSAWEIKDGAAVKKTKKANVKDYRIDIGIEFETGASSLKVPILSSANYGTNGIRTPSDFCPVTSYTSDSGAEIRSATLQEPTLFEIMAYYDAMLKRIRKMATFKQSEAIGTHMHFSVNARNDFALYKKALLRRTQILENTISLFNRHAFGLSFFDVMNCGGRRKTGYGFPYRLKTFGNKKILYNTEHRFTHLPGLSAAEATLSLSRTSLLRFVSVQNGHLHMEYRGMDGCHSALLIGLKAELLQAILKMAVKHALNGNQYPIWDIASFIKGRTSLAKDVTLYHDIFDVVCRKEARVLLDACSVYLSEYAYVGLLSWINYADILAENIASDAWYTDLEEKIIAKIGPENFITNEILQKYAKDTGYYYTIDFSSKDVPEEIKRIAELAGNRFFSTNHLICNVNVNHGTFGYKVDFSNCANCESGFNGTVKKVIIRGIAYCSNCAPLITTLLDERKPSTIRCRISNVKKEQVFKILEGI